MKYIVLILIISILLFSCTKNEEMKTAPGGPSNYCVGRIGADNGCDIEIYI